MDCTDLRAILSGLIDGELPSERQHAAERHLVECSACREVVARTEALDATLRSASLRWGRETALPAAVVEGVLARTVADVGSLRRARRSAVAGWLTAAAALGLAATLWSSQRGASSSESASARDGGLGESPVAPSRASASGANVDGDGASPTLAQRDRRSVAAEGPAPRPPETPATTAPETAVALAAPSSGDSAMPDESEASALVAIDDGGLEQHAFERSTAAVAPSVESQPEEPVGADSSDVSNPVSSSGPAPGALASAAPESVRLPLHGPPRWLSDLSSVGGGFGGTGGSHIRAGSGSLGASDATIEEADWVAAGTGDLELDELVARIQEGGDAMFLASVLLSRLEFADPSDASELDRISQIVRYDRLLDRLDAVRALLVEPQSRGAVEVAESMLLKVEQGPLEPGELAELQRAIQRIELPARLERTVRRLESRSPA